MQKEIGLSVVLWTYLDRPIHDIHFNGSDLGVANAYGSTGIISGVRIPFGLQTFSWTLGGPAGKPGNGQVIHAKNKLFISPQDIPQGTRYIGLHLYPDYTAEIAFSDAMPDTTARGDKILIESEKHGR